MYSLIRGCPDLVLGNQFLGNSTKWCCVHTLSTQYMTVYIVVLHFALSDATLKYELSSKNKAVDCTKLTKIVCTQGPSAHFCARVQGLDLILRHRHHARILVWVPKKRVCSHSCPLSTVLGHCAWSPSVNAA